MEMDKMARLIKSSLKHAVKNPIVKCSEGALQRVNVNVEYEIGNEIKTYKTYRYKPIYADIGNIILMEMSENVLNKNNYSSAKEEVEAMYRELERAKKRNIDTERRSKMRHSRWKEFTKQKARTKK